MKKFSFSSRYENIKKMQDQIFDLVVIGGGINGAGVARDSAARGMKVALIETNDFASGTSSKSSKLIHGGIRYLENMEFKLVFEALNERTKLFAMAPHLVHPLRFMIPLYKESRVGMFKMGMGMWLYDALSLFQAPELHERCSRGESLARMPALNADQLIGSYIYSDAYMDDDRLVLETLRSANEFGAVCANYVKATGAKFDESGKISQVTCFDSVHRNEFTIKARHVISSVGPWTDQLGNSLFKDWKSILRPTKGVHLTFSKNRLPLSSAVVMGAEKGNRIVFGIPRHEMIIIGTTDTDFKESPESVTATAEDIKYLLEITDQYFPGAQIKAKDIIASYAGVRPLVYDGSQSEGKTSREHTIITDPRGVTFVAGGKYTTYRLMCQQTVDRAIESFPIEDQVRFRSADTSAPLNEYTSQESYQQAQILADVWAQSFHREIKDITSLTQRYGMEAEVICEAHPSHYNYWQLEAAQAIDTTMCLHLRDFYARRVHLFLADPAHGMSQLDQIAQVFREKMGWSEQQLRVEIEMLKQYVATELEWKNEFL